MTLLSIMAPPTADPTLQALGVVRLSLPEAVSFSYTLNPRLLGATPPPFSLPFNSSSTSPINVARALPS